MNVVQLLLAEENDKERPENLEDDEDGHLLYNKNDVIRKRCKYRWLQLAHMQPWAEPAGFMIDRPGFSNVKIASDNRFSLGQ